MCSLLVDLGQDAIRHHRQPRLLAKGPGEGGDATYSLSRNRVYSSSPTLTGEPPNYTTIVSPSFDPHLYACLFHWGEGGIPYRRDQHAVASLHAHRHALAVPVQASGANSQHLCLVEVLDGRLGEVDAGGGLGLGLDALDEDAVQEGHERLDGADRGRLKKKSQFSICRLSWWCFFSGSQPSLDSTGPEEYGREAMRSSLLLEAGRRVG